MGDLWIELIAEEKLEYNDGVQTLGKGFKIKELFVFLSVFALFLVAAEGFLTFVSTTLAFSPEFSDRLATDNEMFVQALGLFGALIALRFVSISHPKNWKAWLQSELFGRGVFHDSRDFIDKFVSTFFRAFFAGSLLVAAMAFLGHATIERVSWDLGSLAVSVPRGLGQVLVLAFWIVARLLARTRLRQVLLSDALPRHELSARLLMIGFESVLLFRIFHGGEEMFARIVTYLVCATLAATFQIWEEGGGETRRLRRSWSLAAFEFGLLTTLFHVYGMPRGVLRFESLLYVFPGPQAETWGWLAQGSLVNQFVFVTFSLIVTGGLLIRAWKRRSNRPLY